MSDYQLYHGDCLAVLRGVAAASVDAVITSPPYNMRLRIRNGKYTEWEKGESFSRKYDHFHDALSIEDYYKFHDAVIGELLRISSIVFINIQILTGSKEAWFRLIGKYHKEIKDVAIWDKGEGQPAINRGVMNRGHELVLILESNASAGRMFRKAHFERGTMSDMWRHGRGGNGQNKGHGAVFPESLVNRMIQGWTLPGDTILDPFTGTGSCGVACMRTGRNFIGIELDETYFNLATTRIANAAGDFTLTEKEKDSGQMALFGNVT